jgi:hypothetical protein
MAKQRETALHECTMLLFLLINFIVCLCLFCDSTRLRHISLEQQCDEHVLKGTKTGQRALQRGTLVVRRQCVQRQSVSAARVNGRRLPPAAGSPWSMCGYRLPGEVSSNMEKTAIDRWFPPIQCSFVIFHCHVWLLESSYTYDEIIFSLHVIFHCLLYWLVDPKTYWWHLMKICRDVPIRSFCPFWDENVSICSH